MNTGFHRKTPDSGARKGDFSQLLLSGQSLVSDKMLRAETHTGFPHSPLLGET